MPSVPAKHLALQDVEEMVSSSSIFRCKRSIYCFGIFVLEVGHLVPAVLERFNARFDQEQEVIH